MISQRKRFLVLMMIITGLLLSSAIRSYGDSVTGTIEYKYDELGNVIEKKVTYSTTPDSETVSTPATPSGPTSGLTGMNYNYSTGGSTSSLGHSVQYRFDWGDGTYSSWLAVGTTSTSKSWSSGGTYIVKAKARCATDTWIESSWSTGLTVTITTDTTPPTGTITINSGATYTNSTSVTLTLTCSDTNGCSQMQFSNDNVTYSTAETYNTTKAYNLPSGDGTKTVYVKFKDTANNWSTPYSDSIVLDTTSPTGTILIDSGAAFARTTNVTLTLSCSDLSGCDKMRFSNNGSSYSSEESFAAIKSWGLTSGDGTKTVYAKFKDTIGNWSIAYTDTIVLNTSCSNSPVRIGSTPYTTLQSAYNAAANGDVIKCHGVRLTQNLTVNRNINVTLQGGYDCGFTGYSGNMTPLKGAITTTNPGGGTITIRNFVLEK